MNRRRMLLANNPLLAGPKLQDRVTAEARPMDVVSEESIFLRVPLRDIFRDPSQPRKEFDPTRLQELADSISEYGILSPLLVRRRYEGGYLLIAGERRLRAAQLLGLEEVPVILEGSSKEEADILAIQLVENLQRENLNSLERAQAMGSLRDTYGLSIREIGRKLGVSKSLVQRSFEILALPEDLLVALREGASESKILLVAKVDDPVIRASLLEDLDLMSRAELSKEILKTAKDSSSRAGSSASKSEHPEDRRVSDELQSSLGLKVRIRRSVAGGAGQLILDFFSDEDLQDLFSRLSGDAL